MFLMNLQTHVECIIFKETTMLWQMKKVTKVCVLKFTAVI